MRLDGGFETEPVLPMVRVDEVLQTLRRHVWLVIVAVLVSLSVGIFLLVTQPASFEASAVLRLISDRRALTQGVSEDVAVDASSGSGESLLLTEVQVLSSQRVLGEVVDSLGLRLTSLTPEFG